MFEMNHFESIGIRLASPETIKSWSHGEVKKPETINYRTLKPERDGLFCERIFGPQKDWECHCGKYKKIRYKGIICDRCGVEVTRSKVRRERLGHIELAAPVSHIWYFRGTPSRMSLLLDVSPKQLERVLYFGAYIVVDPGTTGLAKCGIIDELEYQENVKKYGKTAFKAMMGAEAVKILLQELDIEGLAAQLHEDYQSASGQKKARIIKRLEVLESFKKSGNKPEWMILDVLPVLPPELRPMVQLDGGRFATSDLNDLYRRVINRNNRLSKLLQLGAPEIIIRNEKRMLQEAVDALIDNGRRGRPVTGASSRALKSLSDMLKGKQGRFRQNLLGKRVDYSGRSVIVVGPELRMHQCGLPKEMALELFKPFVMKRLVLEGHAQHIKTAKRMVERAADVVWDILEDVIKDHPVMLNRAPTLHRLGIQAFEPVLVEGRAIKLHPLVCTAFNADFDGDQMAVHVPLSAEAQAEARFLMLSTNNLLKPQDGNPVTVPTQDMILGCYYLTITKPNEKGEGMVFSSIDEAIMAYGDHHLELHAPIGIRVTREFNGAPLTRIVKSTLGRFIFNEIIPQDLGYVDRTKEGNELVLECDFVVGKKQLADVISRSIRVHGIGDTAKLLDNIKAMGYKYSTRGGISIGIEDMIVPDVKEKMVHEAEDKVEYINKMYKRGLLDEDGRYTAVVKIWSSTTDAITKALIDSLGEYNPIKMMADSGARGSSQQIKQLAGMRGNMADTSGKTIEIPIKSNLREGMNVLEFFISSHGARKALSDTALKTADSGYLTRRLVDVAQDVIVTEEDCGTDDFTWVKEIATVAGTKKDVVKSISDRLTGRYAAEDIYDLNDKNNLIVARNDLITADLAKKIEACGYEKVKIRSVFDCRARHGVCSKCYGLNLASGQPTIGGEAVGIMAAQSIGEPGTQLTMRTFHTGGIASGDDITQGLPRVEELFEARKPKGQATISEIDGIVSITEDQKHKKVIVVTPATPEGEAITVNPNPDSEIEIEEKRYAIPYSATLKVKEGEFVEAGDLLTDGTVSPQEIMKIKGVRGVQKYIVSEVIKVYKSGGVTINDKHIEVITRQMMRKIRIDDPGDTDLMTGSTVDMFDFEDANVKAEAEGKEPAKGKRILLGITKASLATDSFLSAASFQETTRVLTDAAVKGKIDPLYGLKENVIIGKLIPAGTGMVKYRNLTAVPALPENNELLGKDPVVIPSVIGEQ
ncbi:MAG: DNA-directed RNA polymerase subunit beta' [Clostridiales bacterium]|nr:DNA-directed RNA polymerase subunit beta' [Candidatus Scatonaster coprocaballi]